MEVSVSFSGLTEDAAGSVEFVEFLVDNALVATVDTSPFVLMWEAEGEGNYEFAARARTSSGVMVTGDALTISVRRPAFVERNGLVAIEAERFTRQDLRRDPGGWQVTADVGGFEGEGYVVVPKGTPGDGDPFGSALIEYDIDFETEGVYTFWYRRVARNDDSNSAHLLFDGDLLSPVMGNAGGTSRQWTWVAFPTPIVITPGRHTIGIVRREWDFRIDRFVMTDSNETVQGQGPPESPFD